VSARALHGKVVIVTGAAQGIGRAYARRLIAEGCQVIMADRAHDRVVEAADHLKAECTDGGGTAVPRHLDVADERSCEALAAEVMGTYGHLDGLVNNAAIFSTITMKPFWELTVSEWDAVLAVNLRGPWLLTKALVPALRNSGSRGGASVVNMASDSVWEGRPGYLHYVASKAGVVGMTHAMSHELGEAGIRVNSVSPGPVYTEVPRATVTEAQKAAMLATQALKRPAGPDDLAGTLVFLLSDDSAYITGQTIHVNGGLIHR